MLTGSRSRSPGMVENYLKYKLDYPRKLIDFLYNECDFSWESVIADIGSGTGTFTRLLLERGSRVVAIEPDRELRETAERILEDEFPRFFSLEATAENTTLSDRSIHHIVCAQSFHFFDTKKCRKEFRRILRPGGSVALIVMMPSCHDEFSSECEALIRRHSKDIPGTGDSSLDSIYSDFFQKFGYSTLSLSSQLSLDFDSFSGRLLSSFNLPGPFDEGHEDLMEEMDLLFELYQQSGRVTYMYDLKVYAGKLDTVG